MKRILLLFVGAIASFFLLAFMDEYESLFLPLIKDSGVENPIFEPEQPEIASEFHRIIKEFNDTLALAYLRSDISGLSSGPLDPKLITPIANEIDYLLREMKVMDMSLVDLSLERIVLLSSFTAKVTTRELISTAYINRDGGGETLKSAPAWHSMEYTLVWGNGSWVVVSFEPLFVEQG